MVRWPGGEQVFAAALVAWLVAFIGDEAVKGAKRGLLGSPESRALLKAMDVAVQATLLSVAEPSREMLAVALQERFTQPPVLTLDGHTRVRIGIIRAVQAQIAPLSDPSMTPTGKSFFEEIGVDSAQIRDELTNVVIRSIEQVAPSFPALAGLVTQLNADAIIERVDAVVEMLGAVQREPDGRALDRTLSGPAHVSRRLHLYDLSANWIEQLTDALLDVPAVANDESRQTVFDMLPDRFRHAIPRSRLPRVQVVQMIRTSANYSGGLRAMLRAIRIVEGDSDPMRRLDDLILSLNGAHGGTVAPHSPEEPDA